MSDLAQKKCVPCEVKIPPYTKDEARKKLSEIGSWELDTSGSEYKIRKDFEFENFKDAIEFVNSVAKIAESEGHHPDIHVHYNIVTIELWTHFIKGLHENDFIVAAKIDTLNN